MIIETGDLTRHALAGETAVVTGAGRGIGFETARSLLWLGARVVVAEVDRRTGRSATADLARQFGADRVTFVRTDVGRKRGVQRLKAAASRAFGPVDVVINNATITPMGAVTEVPIARWDASYRVNLRAPVLLARAFLPGMIQRNAGVFVCVSSVGEAYMGAYETFKAAQVHLANTLDAELEGTNVHAFAIGPGLVRTPGALAGIEALAPLYDKSVDEFFAMSEEHIISAEAAGAGFAAAVALAERFRGQETSSRAALIAAGIDLDGEATSDAALTPEQRSQALALCRQIRRTLQEQSEGWAERPLFERQWMIRDFKRNAGMPVERWLEALDDLARALESGRLGAVPRLPLRQLAGFYAHMQDLARGYEKDPQKLAENLRIVQGWQDQVEELVLLMEGPAQSDAREA